MAQTSTYKWSNNHKAAPEVFVSPVKGQTPSRNTTTMPQSFKTAPVVGHKTGQNKTPTFQKPAFGHKPAPKGVGEGDNKINNRKANTLSNYKQDKALSKRGLR